MRTFIKSFNFLIIICTAFVGLTGCVKKDPESRIAQVLMVPLIPNLVPIASATPAISVDFSINGVLQATSVGYSTTAGTLRYAFPYFTVTPRDNSVIAYNLTGTQNVIASVTTDLKENQVYSSFLIDSIQKAKAVIVKDDLNPPSAGRVKIRFFHFSPNALALDVLVQGTSNKMFTNRSFNDQFSSPFYQNFIEMDAGTYTFVFLNAATGATVYTTSAQVLLPDRIYTLEARGVVGNVTSPIGAFVYANKP